jgi:hypothetical protein
MLPLLLAYVVFRFGELIICVRRFYFGIFVGHAQPQNFNPCFRNYFVNGWIFEKKKPIGYEMCI